MAKKNNNKQNKKNPIGLIVGTLLIAAIIGAIVYVAPKAKDAIDDAIDNVNNQIQDTMNNNAYSGKYNIGAISANGAPTSSKNCFYTKDYFECKGLKVTLTEDADIKYQIFFYDSEKHFLASTEILKSNFDQSIEPHYYYARIMFITNVDYQLQITHLNEHINKFIYSASKEQDLKFIEGFKYVDGYIKGDLVQMEGIVNENSESVHNYTRAINKTEYSKGIVINIKKTEFENNGSGINMTNQHPYGYQESVLGGDAFLVYEDDEYIAYYYTVLSNLPEYIRFDVTDSFVQYYELYLIH